MIIVEGLRFCFRQIDYIFSSILHRGIPRHRIKSNIRILLLFFSSAFFFLWRTIWTENNDMKHRLSDTFCLFTNALSSTHTYVDEKTHSIYVIVMENTLIKITKNKKIKLFASLMIFQVNLDRRSMFSFRKKSFLLNITLDYHQEIRSNLIKASFLFNNRSN